MIQNGPNEIIQNGPWIPGCYNVLKVYQHFPLHMMIPRNHLYFLFLHLNAERLMRQNLAFSNFQNFSIFSIFCFSLYLYFCLILSFIGVRFQHGLVLKALIPLL